MKTRDTFFVNKRVFPQHQPRNINGQKTAAAKLGGDAVN
ncbi:MAG: hypothetical protein BWY90_01642 [Deltaproteobacteria bacterium ADurb.BinA014]|nr:MAG: hypothetical protein BWY90_01642 [Deltaproteobacteria bacterium ADurb.BinA014]